MRGSMRRQQTLVLSTLAFFCALLASLGIHRSIVSEKPIAIDSKLYPSIGNEEAKVEVVVFEDLTCHMCRYFTMEVFPRIQSSYIAPGIVKYVMIPVAFLPNSQEISNAALAVFYQAPESFFPFVREYFVRLSGRIVDLNDLIELAKEFEGIDLPFLEESVKIGRFNAQLEENLQLATKAMKKNVRTPAVFINGAQSPGVSFKSISSHIEALK
jgi:protein-disulfide isomerase